MQDDGYDVRWGGLGLRQLGVAVTHCKLDAKVANLMKVLCSQEIYRQVSFLPSIKCTLVRPNVQMFVLVLRYALMEMGYDAPDIPIGMLSEFHLRKCELRCTLLYSFFSDFAIIGI